jgi:hypothetical protein
MTMATDTEKWLATEEATSQLLSQLERLKQEVEGYANAKTTLAEANTQLARLVGELSNAAQASQGISERLGEVGTPEVLDRLTKLQQALLAVGRIVQREEKQLTEGTSAVLEKIEQSQREVALLRDQLPSIIAGEARRQQRPMYFLLILILLVAVTLLVLRFLST